MIFVPPAPAPTYRLRRAAASLVILAIVVLALGLPAAAPISAAAHRGAAAEVEYARAAPPVPVVRFVNMTDAPAFVPSSISGGLPGGNVTVQLQNLGGLVHSFTVAAQPGPVLDPTWSPAQLSNWFNQNGSLVNVSLVPGSNSTVTVLIPATSAPGASYEFVSVVPYQFQAGMRGYLNLTVGPGTVLHEAAQDALKFLPDMLVVNATSFPVVLDVEILNQGTYSHTWTLVPQAGVFLQFGNFSNYFKNHTALANAVIPGTAAPVWANFSIAAKGVYEYLCTVSGHFAAGMNGTLWVGITPPPAAPPVSTGVVQEYILLAAGLLLATATFLAFVANYVGRVAPAQAPPRH